MRLPGTTLTLGRSTIAHGSTVNSDVVAVSGEIDVATVPDLHLRLCEAIAAHPGDVVIVDLGPMTFIDSTGLGCLVGALKRARLAGGDLLFTHPPHELWRVFSVTGLDKALPFAAEGD